jgi:hypothetical protein
MKINKIKREFRSVLTDCLKSFSVDLSRIIYRLNNEEYIFLYFSLKLKNTDERGLLEESLKSSINNYVTKNNLNTLIENHYSDSKILYFTICIYSNFYKEYLNLLEEKINDTIDIIRDSYIEDDIKEIGRISNIKKVKVDIGENPVIKVSLDKSYTKDVFLSYGELFKSYFISILLPLDFKIKIREFSDYSDSEGFINFYVSLPLFKK